MSPFAFVIGAIAFVLTTVLILGLRPIARAFGLVDVPNFRKVHEGEIPLIGGLAIFASVLLTHLISEIVFPGSISPTGMYSFYLAGAVLVVAGMVDDYRGLSPLSRIIIEIVAVLVMIYGGGVVVTDLGTMTFDDMSVSLGTAAIPFTVFATVALINAINMSDGLDGLAGSLAFIPIIGFIVACELFGNMENNLILVLIAASIFAFLMFNVTVPGKRRALIFLGDSGSMFLGLVLAWFVISLSQGEERAITPAATLWFLTLPIFDIVCMTFRRVMRRRAPFSPDKEHLHHVFLLAGFTVTETVGIMAGLSAIGVVVGLVGTAFGVPDLLLAGSFLILGLLYFWVILRSWTIMRFLRRSICRRREFADRRTYGERRRGDSKPYLGPEHRSVADRRRQDRRKFNSSTTPSEKR